MQRHRLQRVIMPLKADVQTLYYRTVHRTGRRGGSAEILGRRSICLNNGVRFRTDTWFNAFFERYWRECTSVDELCFRLVCSGSSILRIYRQTAQRGTSLICEQSLSGRKAECTVPVSMSDESGLLFFELEATSSSFTMHEAEWLSSNAPSKRVQLIPSYCTYNRSSQLLSNLRTIAEDEEVIEQIEHILVVDQGAEKVREHSTFIDTQQTLCGRLRLLEQANRGGTGGFTRCLLEARNIDEATHVLFLDDDAEIEPEAILRTAAFLALARNEIAVGGFMLDQTRPHELVDAGNRFIADQLRINEPSRHEVDSVDALMPYLSMRPVDYNGWWFFAVPLLNREVTTCPLPLFLRGDDVEFGIRLLRQNVPTIVLTGLSVWHAPFEKKTRSWHPFYEMRNYLVIAALHERSISPFTIARRFFSRLLDELLTYDYYESYLLCEAVKSFLCGPVTIMISHSKIESRGIEFRNQEATELELVDCRTDQIISTNGIPSRWVRSRRLWYVLRNFALPSPREAAIKRTIAGTNEQWYHVADVDAVKVVEPLRSVAVKLRRNRRFFLRFILLGLWLGLRIVFGYRAIAQGWREQAPYYASTTFWESYLGEAIEVSEKCSETASV